MKNNNKLNVFFRNMAIFVMILSIFCLCGCTGAPKTTGYRSGIGKWEIGFASDEISIPESEEPLYIAGYKGGREIEGVLDLQKVSAVWLEVAGKGILLIGVDCVGLGSDTIKKIRNGLSTFCKNNNCISVNVYSTHTHAGIDTLGLWGPAGVDGKNEDFMNELVDTAITVAKLAHKDKSEGKVYYGETKTEDLLIDSREPVEFDSTLRQFRFVSDSDSKNGVRLFSYSAHAESLRGDNLLVSRDFPGYMCDKVSELSGDDCMFMPGAIGGLIMTKELLEPFSALANMEQTGELLAGLAMGISNEVEVSAEIGLESTTLWLPLDNNVFLYYRFLGILGNNIREGIGKTGYDLQTEIGVLRLGDYTLVLMPGEIFPELVSGEGLDESDPIALEKLAKNYGLKNLIIIGLCNDEIGYIVPPSNYLINPDSPYLEGIEDETGENHYEETNSVGEDTAVCLAEAFDALFKKFK